MKAHNKINMDDPGDDDEAFDAKMEGADEWRRLGNQLYKGKSCCWRSCHVRLLQLLHSARDPYETTAISSAIFQNTI